MKVLLVDVDQISKLGILGNKICKKLDYEGIAFRCILNIKGWN